MSVLDRAALEESPLADLHAIASELSIDGYRRLRRPALIDAVLERQGGEAAASVFEEAAEELIKKKREKRGRAARADGGEEAREERAAKDEEASAEDEERAAEDEERAAKDEERAAKDEEASAEDEERAAEDEEPSEEPSADDEKPTTRRRRGRRGGRGRSAARDEAATAEETEQEAEAEREPEPADEPEPESEPEPADDEEPPVEGVVELLPNGSGFLRVAPPEPSDDDVYISAAQVKRCELVSGDRVAGPRRAPRRSERFASLVRIDTINGRPATELISGARFEDLPAAFADEHLRLGSADPTINAIERLTPFGKGSRVTITGGPRAGKTEALRRLAQALAGHEDIQLSIALAGVRPEEISEWGGGPTEPTAAVSFAASADAQDHAVELVIDQARRIAARGAHAVVLIDTLDGLHPHAARKAIAAARNIVDGGSLTVIATASEPLGGETTVISLDPAAASLGRFPAIDLAHSGTLRAELLVGEAGTEAIAVARREAAERG